jgi:hypothetical protein
MREFFGDLFKGKDRGYPNYRETIERAIQRGGGGAYQYAPPAHVSNFLVQRSVRGLGCTEVEGSDSLAGIVDLLLEVLHRDPTAAVRATASHQLGRILLTLPEAGLPPPVANVDQKIHQNAMDLFHIQGEMKKGTPILPEPVVGLVRGLGGLTPGHILSAREMMRALAGPPVSPARNAAIVAARDEVVPAAARAAILVALRDVGTGQADGEPDPSALVRIHATEVLARVGSPVALGPAVERLGDSVDSPERDPDVRRQLVAYLGAVGGPASFEACLQRLDDADSGVRFHAHRALLRMTGADEPPDGARWRAWREQHPAWRLPAGTGGA